MFTSVANVPATVNTPSSVAPPVATTNATPSAAKKKTGSKTTAAKRAVNSINNGSVSSPANTSKTTFQVGNSVNIEVTTSDPNEMKSQYYKQKCAKTEKKLKELVFLNAALEAEVNETHAKVAEVKEERKFLLNRLLSYQKEGSDSSKILQTALSKKSVKSDKSQVDSSRASSNKNDPL